MKCQCCDKCSECPSVKFYNGELPLKVPLAKPTEEQKYTTPSETSYLFSLNIINGTWWDKERVLRVKTDGKIIVFADRPGNWSKVLSDKRFYEIFKSGFSGNVDRNPNSTINFMDKSCGKIAVIKIKDVRLENGHMYFYFDKMHAVGMNDGASYYCIRNGSMFIDGYTDDPVWEAPLTNAEWMKIHCPKLPPPCTGNSKLMYKKRGGGFTDDKSSAAARSCIMCVELDTKTEEREGFGMQGRMQGGMGDSFRI